MKTNIYDISVAIIIPCRNEIDHIRKILDTAISQSKKFKTSEIIIADGMSDDGTREIIKEFISEKNIHLIDNHKRIVSSGLNLAILSTECQIIIRMDAHVEYASDYIEKSVYYLLKTEAQNVGGPARTKHSSYIQEANSLCYHSKFSVGGARFHDVDYEGEVDTVTFGCWQKRYLIEIGLFDEELVRNQDDELNFRINLAGGKVWQAPQIKSWYYPRSRIRDIFMQYFQYGYWKVYVNKKHRTITTLRQLIPSFFMTSLLAGIVLSFVHWLFAFLLMAEITLYLSGCLFFAIKKTKKLNQAMPVILTFFILHAGYGLGYLLGAIEFIVFRGNPANKNQQLTR